jgi:hypothetical protein
LDKIYRIIKYWYYEPSEIQGSWEEGMAVRKVQNILEAACYTWKERSYNSRTKSREKCAINTLRAEVYPSDSY